jgi:hypothetical protein
MNKAYFARPITHFNTQQERIDITCIELLGFEVVDITTKEIQEQYTIDGMKIFSEIIDGCDALFFLAFEDGAIGAGVALEIGWAGNRSIPVFELPQRIRERTLTVNQTRLRLRK